MYFAPRIGFFNMDSNGGLWDAVFYVRRFLCDDPPVLLQR
jgi:hypothetical protein